MTSYAELEFAIRRSGSGSYAVDLRFSQAGGETDERLAKGLVDVSLDFDQLRACALDPSSYAHELTASFFQDPELKAAFVTARTNSQSANASLRVRLFIDFSAPELHGLCWELLQDPDTGAPLFTGEGILFSRYLSSSDWRPVTLRPKSDLKALVAIANPADLDSYQLAPVDVAGELKRAHVSLSGIAITALPSSGSANLNNLATTLRDGYDVLYLVCHGTLVDGRPCLWMEDQDGNLARTAGADFVARLSELQNRPRLVVLASCQSAGVDNRNTGQTLAALGPQLAEAGIPAVIAMQGSVSMETIATFMPVFFGELLRDGQIDRAMAVARGAVRDRPDYWMPILFMRLRSGRIWYVPGFGSEQDEFEKWPALLSRIHAEPCRCTPILGSGLTENFIGSTREIAQRWAETFHFPMAPSDREDLPNVAQYLAATQDRDFPRTEFRNYLRTEILRRSPVASPDAKLDELVEFIGAQRRGESVTEPHRVLAGLPFAVYITTNPDALLESALREVGKSPESEICRWNVDLETLPSIYDKEPDYRPDVSRPLVYHLFGRLSQPESVVLTEDDYFDYLIGVTSNKDLIPGVVRAALANSALLFLGFQMDDWNFRVLFRSIMNQEGGGRRARYKHVAVQIDLEQGRILDPERARRYLETYFQDVDISIYWGSMQDFVNELASRSLQAGAAAG